MSSNNQQMSLSAAILPKGHSRSTSGPDPKKPRVQATPAVAPSENDKAPLMQLPEIHICNHEMIRGFITVLETETSKRLVFQNLLQESNDENANLKSEISQLQQKIADLEKQLIFYKNDAKNVEKIANYNMMALTNLRPARRAPSPVPNGEDADPVASLAGHLEALEEAPVEQRGRTSRRDMYSESPDLEQQQQKEARRDLMQFVAGESDERLTRIAADKYLETGRVKKMLEGLKQNQYFYDPRDMASLPQPVEQIPEPDILKDQLKKRPRSIEGKGKRASRSEASDEKDRRLECLEETRRQMCEEQAKQQDANIIVVVTMKVNRDFRRDFMAARREIRIEGYEVEENDPSRPGTSNQ